MNTQNDHQSRTIRDIQEKLHEILENEPNTIRAEVAQEALDYGAEDLKDFFYDLTRCGCISGMICGLVYYVDTHAFFDKYYSEIEILREEMEESLGEPITIKGELKNTLAWLGFEETAFQMAVNDLEIEI